MRITRQCDGAEAREIFSKSHDNADAWIDYTNDYMKNGCSGTVSYSVFGFVIYKPTRRLFTVEEHYVDDEGSLDCANRVCLHAVGKYLARYGFRIGAPIGEFGVGGGNYEVERMWGREHSSPVRIVGRSYGKGDAYYA